MKTFELNSKGRVIGGSLIVVWDTHVLEDYQNCTGETEIHLRKVNESHKFYYINDDGTRKR